MLTSDERRVLERLERWCARVDLVRGMFGHEYPETVRSAYAALKRDLKDESHSVSNSRRDPPLTDAEKRFYDRPIRHAAAHLIAPTNARTEKIRDSVSEAHQDLFLGLSRLKEYAER